MAELNYDFLAPATELQNSKQQAIEMWRASARAAVGDASSVMQDASGVLDEQQIRRLLREQNRQPITLTE